MTFYPCPYAFFEQAADRLVRGPPGVQRVIPWSVPREAATFGADRKQRNVPASPACDAEKRQ
jgi:hypothetical protein